MKKYFQSILIIIIIGICSHLIVCNVEQINYLSSKKYTYDFKDGREIKSIKNSLLIIENNISKLYVLKDSYLSTDEIETIKNNLNATVEVAKSLNFWKHKKIYSMSQVELSKLIQDTQRVGVLTSVDIYRMLSEGNSSFNMDKFIDYTSMQLLSNNNIDMLLFDNYKYMSNNTNVDAADISIKTVMNTLSMKLSTIEYVSNLVIESGDINE